jgi:cobalt-zinc-cadmium resistance protein CzcA
VRASDLGSTVEEAQRRIAKTIHLPTGYRLVWAGEFGELQAAKARLAIIVPIALLLIVALLYALFNSLRDSLLALIGIPFAVAGGVLALYVTGLHFSISAGIGFISLFGVSVRDGVLMISYYEAQLRQGGAPVDAMFRAASQRMRPALMTAMSGCIGLLPAAISTEIGSQVQRPLATVVVGGLFLGPLMLLVVVPALRMIFLSQGGVPQTGDTA